MVLTYLQALSYQRKPMTSEMWSTTNDQRKEQNDQRHTQHSQFQFRNSCWWANDRAHNRRYDAVWDTVPRTYSIVSMTCPTSLEQKSKGKVWPRPSCKSTYRNLKYRQKHRPLLSCQPLQPPKGVITTHIGLVDHHFCQVEFIFLFFFTEQRLFITQRHVTTSSRW